MTSGTCKSTYPVRLWKLSQVAWFRRTNDPLGNFSNFASQMPINLLNYKIASSEHLYQAMRFTHLPEIQFAILMADSPKSCKNIAYHHLQDTREDWLEIREQVMRWVLALKIKAHPKRLTKKFDESGDKPIVEYSGRDAFWGAQPVDGSEDSLRGQNVLGCLLSELRDATRVDPFLQKESKPRFARALLLGSPLM